MSQYIYAIIPYKSGISVRKTELYPCVLNPVLSELNGIHSEFADSDGLYLFKDFLMINTCQRQTAFVDNRDGFSYMRSEICKIAKALKASEVWYVAEMLIDEMEEWGFSFDEWCSSLKGEKKDSVAELTIDILKGKDIYSCYHDNFSDVIFEKPAKIINRHNWKNFKKP